MTDWTVWPIFILELIAIILLFFREDSRIFSARPRKIILGILLICCITIAVSLYHDSATILHLHF